MSNGPYQHSRTSHILTVMWLDFYCVVVTFSRCKNPKPDQWVTTVHWLVQQRSLDVWKIFLMQETAFLDISYFLITAFDVVQKKVDIKWEQAKK